VKKADQRYMKNIAMFTLLLAAASFAQQTPASLTDGTLEQASSANPVDLSALRYLPGEPGTSKILLRLDNTADAAALRLHFTDMALPAGATVTVYGVDEQRRLTRLDGPFTAAGPMHGQDFWTRPIPGRAIYIELQTPVEQATLPFTLAGWEAAEPYDFEPLSPAASADVETQISVFRGEAVAHQVVDGVAIWEGDMLLGRREEMEPYTGNPKQLERAVGAIASSAYRWPNGVVPYTISASLPNAARVTSAITHWNTSLAGNLRLVPRTNETYYISFVPAAPSTCSSYVGYIRMVAQPVNIGDYCSVGNIIHEIGHAVGLYHEQSRSDRDNFVRIVSANIDPAAAGNFSKMTTSFNPGAYDYASIMHYPATAFSINGQATIVTIPAGIPIGQRSTLSTLDVSGVRAMYPATTGGTTPPTPPPPTTPTTPSTTTVAMSISSSPTGRTLVVDNVNYNAPVTLQWALNSTHTVNAPHAVTSTTKFTFQRWSDGGAQSHQVVARAAGSLTAFYSLGYRFTTEASAGGQIVQSVTTSDSYYPAGTTMQVNATPNANFCFAGWTGLISLVDPALLVTINGSGALRANFVSGSVSVPTSMTVAKAGGAVSAAITANAGCVWRARSYAPWITIISASTGSGSTALRLQIPANPSPAPRASYVQVGNRLMLVVQN
jgi:hypothetical protein